ncbi:A24 family peptidase [Limibaculum sp. FT325]|uniref:prepilin peptidase n=1 Tax=Thermohalobaculum sediminis TaxID=2939436 RepID=UPI0020C1414B|nr:A24 family peptidase [Limibaculum sediminis]MCL5778419.1 A24 family peptidase [Limibaculum sediminis]
MRARLSGPSVLPSAVLGSVLVTASEIDRRQMILPDALTLPLIPLGLGTVWLAAPAALGDATVGAVAGGVVLWALRAGYARIRGREGLGLGDVKLFAAAGAWTGWAGLPGVLLWAGVLGLGAALIAGMRRGDVSGGDALPFGPFLAAGLWPVWSLGPIAFGG